LLKEEFFNTGNPESPSSSVTSPDRHTPPSGTHTYKGVLDRSDWTGERKNEERQTELLTNWHQCYPLKQPSPPAFPPSNDAHADWHVTHDGASFADLQIVAGFVTALFEVIRSLDQFRCDVHVREIIRIVISRLDGLNCTSEIDD